MNRLLATAVALAALLFVSTSGAVHAQERLLVVVVDPGPTRLNQNALINAIGRSTRRAAIRMTDERAPGADGRLSIAFSRPDRWVLRYEAGGQVAWVSDRIRGAGLRSRLVRLSREVVGVVESTRRDAPERAERTSRSRERARSRDEAWDEAIILALQNELVDPFENDPPRRRRARPVSVLWSEVVDPFDDRAPRAAIGEVWSEVLDPWSVDVRRR